MRSRHRHFNVYSRFSPSTNLWHDLGQLLNFLNYLVLTFRIGLAMLISNVPLVLLSLEPLACSALQEKQQCGPDLGFYHNVNCPW